MSSWREVQHHVVTYWVQEGMRTNRTLLSPIQRFRRTELGFQPRQVDERKNAATPSDVFRELWCLVRAQPLCEQRGG